MSERMKAVTYTQYGPPEVLQLVEVDRPVPSDTGSPFWVGPVKGLADGEELTFAWIDW